MIFLLSERKPLSPELWQCDGLRKKGPPTCVVRQKGKKGLNKTEQDTALGLSQHSN